MPARQPPGRRDVDFHDAMPEVLARRFDRCGLEYPGTVDQNIEVPAGLDQVIAGLAIGKVAGEPRHGWTFYD